MAKKEHYVDNKKFLEAMIEYIDKVKLAEKENKPKPKISNYIGECFMKIAEHYSHKPNFIKYPFRDEMISDAIETCVRYSHNFNYEKYSNPFSYFSQFTFYAFLRRIDIEKEEFYIKCKSTEMAGVLHEMDSDGESDGNFKQFEHYDNIAEFIDKFEKSKKSKKNKILEEVV